jgi:beta-phosphoglucomutase-like phosphatase (HAD superfamily)
VLLSDFSHVIFDLDGVLLDTEPLYTEATQRVVSQYGKTFDWSLKSLMMGRHELEAAELLVKTLELPITAEEYIQRSVPIAEGLFASAAELPGAEAFVTALAARGHVLAVGTSSTRRLYELKTNHLPWFRVFSAVVSGDHPEVRALKPAPDIFLAARARHRRRPSALPGDRRFTRRGDGRARGRHERDRDSGRGVTQRALRGRSAGRSQLRGAARPARLLNASRYSAPLRSYQLKNCAR